MLLGISKDLYIINVITHMFENTATVILVWRREASLFTGIINNLEGRPKLKLPFLDRI